MDRRTTSEPPFYRPCWAEVDAAALKQNLTTLRARLSPGAQALAVVKANGYGHGLSLASQTAVEAGAVYLGVSSLEEGITLRAAGFKIPILILGSLYSFQHFSLLFDYQLTPTVASLEVADALDALSRQHGQRWPVHLKIDSGFGRIGVSIPNALEFIKQVSQRPGLQLEGIYTHFASSDVDPEYTQSQAQAFKTVLQQAFELGIRPRWTHMANSAALLRFPETHGTLVRPGIAYYGIPPYPGAEGTISLRPALTLKSQVIFLKTILSGTSISYARTWTADRPTRVATLAVGYADGLPRLLSNKGHALLHGQRVPIIGRVTMDMTMVDVTDLPECHVGDEAVLLGTQGTVSITAQEVAEAAQTNAYEILCGIGARVPRLTVGQAGA